MTVARNGMIMLCYEKGNHTGGVTSNDYPRMNASSNPEEMFVARTFRLTINTIAYMKCYPECVIEGTPRITVSQDEYRTKNNTTLEVSDMVIESVADKAKGEKAPHFRSGYWKYLASDFYTNMQGQLVFVSETMVKAKEITKTVNKAEDLSRFTNQ